MGTLSRERADRLLWLGRYVERAYTTQQFILAAYDASLDETRFIVSEENLPPYLALTEQLTRCNVYLVDSHHNVTGYFDGVVQVLSLIHI